MTPRSRLESLLDASPSRSWTDGQGEVVAKIPDVRFGDIAAIHSADWNRYSTCRGCVPREALSRLLDVLMDSSNEFSENDHSEAENEGLWDWISHQSTLYSVSPLFLDLAFSRCQETGRTPPPIDHLASIFSKVGSGAIYLTANERRLNKQGRLPIFRIEDVLSKHQWGKGSPAIAS